MSVGYLYLDRSLKPASRLTSRVVLMSEFLTPSPAAALAASLVMSLILMGSSRKVFGPEVVARWLVPHRADIGCATFLAIGVAVLVHIGLLDSSFGPGGAAHYVPVVGAQIGYFLSLVSRKDLPPAHPHRAFALTLVWLGLVVSPGVATTIALEVASVWTVKLLHLTVPSAADSAVDAVAVEAGRAMGAKGMSAKAKPKKAQSKSTKASRGRKR